MVTSKKFALGKVKLLQIACFAMILCSIGLSLGCGGSQGLVEMPDDPIPKPDNVVLDFGNSDEVTK